MGYIGHIPYDPQSDQNQYLRQALQQYGTAHQAASKERQQEANMAKFIQSLNPTQTPTAGGQSIFTPGGAEALTEGFLGGQQTKTGMIQGARLQPMQIMQKALQAGLPMNQALQVARFEPTAQQSGSGYTLSEGQTRFDAQGKQIAKGTPRQEKRKGFSLSEQKTLADTIPMALDNIESTVKETAIKGFNKPSTADLAAAYKQIAIELGYETWTPDKRKQFDLKWDRKARARFKVKKAKSSEDGSIINIGWNPNGPEVKQARKELREGTAVATETQQPQELDSVTAAAILQEAGGDKEKARKLAKERGFTF